MIKRLWERLRLMQSRDKAYGAFIFAVSAIGLFLRLWWVHHIPTEQRFDFATYQTIAQNIYNGLGHTLAGYPVAWQGSGYSYLLAFVYRLAGNTNELTGKYLNVFLSCATLVPVYWIDRRLFKKKAQAAVAFAVTACLPHLIAYTNVLGTETLFLFLIACIVCFQLYLGDRRYAYPLLGFLCGAAALTKPFMLAYPAVLLAARWVARKNVRQAFFGAALAAVVMAVVVAPWTYRNYRLFGRFIPVSYNGGYVLYINNNDTNVTGTWLDLSAVETTADVKAQIDGALATNAGNVKLAHAIEPLLKTEAQNWIKNHPAAFLELGILRLKATFFSGANDITQWAMNGWAEAASAGTAAQQRTFNTVQAVFDGITFVLSAAGLLFLFMTVKDYAAACFSKHRALGLPVNLLFIHTAFFVAIPFVFEGQARYLFPALLFFVPAAVLLTHGERNDAS